MRHGASGRRSRNRGNGGGGSRRNGGGQPRTQVFDSNGPDVRIRGTAWQIQEKYVALAKDAAAAGDRILAESYLQHAEHYQRLINSWQLSQPAVSHDSAASEEQSGEGSFDAQDVNPPAMDDDLSLPVSILGKKADVKNEAVSQGTAAELADA